MRAIISDELLHHKRTVTQAKAKIIQRAPRSKKAHDPFDGRIWPKRYHRGCFPTFELESQRKRLEDRGGGVHGKPCAKTSDGCIEAISLLFSWYGGPPKQFHVTWLRPSARWPVQVRQ